MNKVEKEIQLDMINEISDYVVIANQRKKKSEEVTLQSKEITDSKELKNIKNNIKSIFGL